MYWFSIGHWELFSDPLFFTGLALISDQDWCIPITIASCKRQLIKAVTEAMIGPPKMKQYWPVLKVYVFVF